MRTVDAALQLHQITAYQDTKEENIKAYTEIQTVRASPLPPKNFRAMLSTSLAASPYLCLVREDYGASEPQETCGKIEVIAARNSSDFVATQALTVGPYWMRDSVTPLEAARAMNSEEAQLGTINRAVQQAMRGPALNIILPSRGIGFLAY